MSSSFRFQEMRAEFRGDPSDNNAFFAWLSEHPTAQERLERLTTGLDDFKAALKQVRRRLWIFTEWRFQERHWKCTPKKYTYVQERRAYEICS